MASKPLLTKLQQAGVSIWLDSLSRDMLADGTFQAFIDDFAVTGATSNPTIFAKAIKESDRYDSQLGDLTSHGINDLQELFFAIGLRDIQDAAALLRPVYDHTAGRDGFVSFECTPDVANDSDATIEQATDLWHRLSHPNVMIKVPGTEAGVPAIEELTFRGVNVNVTLLFSPDRCQAVHDAFIRGLQRRANRGWPVDTIASAASVFLSRIDHAVDDRLPAAWRGTVAIALAQEIYTRHLDRLGQAEWRQLASTGARSQRLLWASTAPKDPAFRDTLYVESLIAPDVISTVPEATLRAFADHGRISADRLRRDARAARELLSHVDRAGVDLGAVLSQLERDGIESFTVSYRQLLADIEARVPR